MGIILIILGVLVIGFGIFGISQPAWNRPELFRSSVGAGVVFLIGVGLLAGGVAAL